MRHRSNSLVLFVAVVGALVCVAAVIHFLLVISNNELPWPADPHPRYHYLAVGHFYTQGFVVGFFFCFSLALVAAGVANWRATVARRQRTSGPAASERPPATWPTRAAAAGSGPVAAGRAGPAQQRS